MICPACREEMIIVEYEQIELDVCPGCKGVWFDADELELLLESMGLSIAGLVRPGEARSAEKKRKCPYCHRKMQKVHMGEQEVLVDRCRHGHGLWFDGGELGTIVRELQHASGAGETVGSFLADVLFAGENTESGEDP